MRKQPIYWQILASRAQPKTKRAMWRRFRNQEYAQMMRKIATANPPLSMSQIVGECRALYHIFDAALGV